MINMQNIQKIYSACIFQFCLLLEAVVNNVTNQIYEHLRFKVGLVPCNSNPVTATFVSLRERQSWPCTKCASSHFGWKMPAKWQPKQYTSCQLFQEKWLFSSKRLLWCCRSAYIFALFKGSTFYRIIALSLYQLRNSYKKSETIKKLTAHILFK